MINSLPSGVIDVKDVTLWAHVGVLDRERILGQNFRLDFRLWIDVDYAAKHDDLSATADYSIAIRHLQKLALSIRCLTIEHFSDQILDLLETLYGPVPMHIVLTKCRPPVDGFSGSVSVERKRYFP